MKHPTRPLPDHACEPDDRELHIDRVGIRDLSYPIRVLDRDHQVQHTVASISAYVGLPKEFKGTHMSRFIEVLNAVRGEMTIRNMPAILTQIQRRLDAHDAYLEVEFPYFLTRKAPVSGAESLMEYRCRFDAAVKGDAFDFVLAVQVPVKSLCPCSKAISDRGAHNQRSIIEVEVRSAQFLWIEDVVEAVEACASAPLYALLKREDEKYITELAYDNPRFVEDLVREVVLRIEALEGVSWLRVRVENHESIHNHSAYAEIERPHPTSKAPLIQHTVGAPVGVTAHRFGAWLRAARTDRRLTQQALAEVIGVTPSHLSRIESDEKAPSEELLKALADALGVEPVVMSLRAGIVPDDLRARIAASPERLLAIFG